MALTTTQTEKTNSQGLDFAGQVFIENATLRGANGVMQNVTAQIRSLSIHEGINNKFLYGNMLLVETHDFASLFPLTGQEILDLILTTPGTEGEGTIDALFYVYKMTNRHIMTDKSIAYKLHFVSLEGFYSLNKKISRAFTGNPTDIMRDILTNQKDGLETGKDLLFEEASREIKYISNYWSPTKNIDYLKSVAVNPNGSPYVFYENRNGFVFLSLERLYLSGLSQTFFLDKYHRDVDEKGRSFRNPFEDYRTILNIKWGDTYDNLKRIASGLFGSRQIGFDLYSHRYFVNDYTILGDEKITSLNYYPTFNGEQITYNEAAQMVYLKNTNTFDEYEDITNQETIQKQKAVVENARGNAVNIVVPGNLLYVCGMKVAILLPKTAPLHEVDTEYHDERFSGNYIVSSLRHDINSTSHFCHMELISDTMPLNPR